MKFDDIRKMVAKDMIIDDTELDIESLKIPQLHNKYLNMFHDERLVLKKLEADKRELARDKWEYYTKWLRPVNNFTLNIGCYVDVLDTVNVWGNGIIKNINIVENNEKQEVYYEKKFHIEFLGWNEYFNEIVSIDKIKPFGTKTLINKESKYLQIQKLDTHHWVFLKIGEIWNKERIKFNEKKKDELSLYISNRLEIFNKKDIDEKIRPCTNAFALLYNNRFEGLIQRNLFI